MPTKYKERSQLPKRITKKSSESLFGHDAVEIISWKFPSISWCSMQHLLQLGWIHGLSKLLCDSFNIAQIDIPSSIVVEKVKYFIDTILFNDKLFTFDYLSPNLEVIPSKNYSKSISLPSAYKSPIMLKMVGFFVSKPKDCMADLSSRGSILPVASVSNRLKASLSYSISSSVRPGL